MFVGLRRMGVGVCTFGSSTLAVCSSPRLQAKCEDLAAAAAAYVCESRRQARTPTLSSRLSALALWFFEAVGVVGVCVALWAAIAPCVLWCMRYRARRPPLFDPTKTKIN